MNKGVSPRRSLGYFPCVCVCKENELITKKNYKDSNWFTLVYKGY